jgi:hypothetical protein
MNEITVKKSVSVLKIKICSPKSDHCEDYMKLHDKLSILLKLYSTEIWY